MDILRGTYGLMRNMKKVNGPPLTLSMVRGRSLLNNMSLQGNTFLTKRLILNGMVSAPVVLISRYFVSSWPLDLNLGIGKPNRSPPDCQSQ